MFGDLEPSLNGKRVLITAGPTHEPIDPVRYLANRSSGKQGFALAKAAAARGASVTLVSGPVSLRAPANVDVVEVETAREMLDAALRSLPVDMAIFAAAVSDWRVSEPAQNKQKKIPGEEVTLSLVENPDILKTVSALPHDLRPKLVVGFAAETENLIANGYAKLVRKGCDVIVANMVGARGAMGSDQNRVHVISGAGNIDSWEAMSKEQVAFQLIDRFYHLLQKRFVPTVGS